MADSMSVTGKSKSISEIYINWKQLTAKEVIKKEKEGQAAPPEILKWAEELAKIANAPDDVTYDIAKGETDIEKLNQLINEAPIEETDTNGKDEEKRPQLSNAQNERKSMEDNGTSLLEQGKTFTDRSKEASTESLKAMISGTVAANTAENISAKAESEAQIIEMVTRNTKKEYDNLMQKAEDKNGEGITASELSKLNTLGNKLNAFGTRGQNNLGTMEQQVNIAGNTINNLENVPLNALDYGSETISIGSELMNGKKANAQPGENAETAASTQNDTAERAQDALTTANETRHNFLGGFNKKAIIGWKAIFAGVKAIGRGNAAENSLAENTEKVSNSKSKINDAQTKVKDSTNVEAQAAPDTNTDNNNQTEDKEQKENNSDKSAGNGNDKNTLADSTITADANEIIKRKERKGLV